MSIAIDNENRIFSLNTAHTTYQLFADEHGFLRHLYYGPSVGSFDMRYTEFFSDCGFSPNPGQIHEQRDFSLDTRPQEYTGCGIGDYRISCLSLANGDGSYSADFRYVGHSVLNGKYSIPGLPASYGSEGCETLQIDLEDPVTGLKLALLYGVFAEKDVITRCAVIKNSGNAPVKLYKAASACLDIPFGKWDLIHFQGRHCMERMPERAPVPHGIMTIGSDREPAATSTIPLSFWLLRKPARTSVNATAPCWCIPATSKSKRSAASFKPPGWCWASATGGLPGP